MIREVFSSIRHNKWRTALILVLSVITFFLLLITLTNSFAFYTQIAEVEKLFLSDTDYIYRVKGQYIENEDTIGVDFEELKAFVNAQENAVYGAYDVVGTSFDELADNSEFISLNQKAYKGTGREAFPEAAEVVFVDTEILQMVNFYLTENDFLQIEKDGELYTPLFAGKDFAGILSVGDTLTMSECGEKYIVSGFLYDKKWFNNSDPITMPPISLDHRFFAPFSELEKQLSENRYNMIMHSTVGKIFMNCSEDIAEEFSSLAMDKGIKFDVASISDFTKEWEDINHKNLRASFFLTVTVLICSAISMISTLCVTVLLRKREYGVRIAFGSTKSRIVSLLCLEILLLNLIAGGIAFIFGYLNYAGEIISIYREVYLKTLCTTSLAALILLILFLTALILFIPVVILKRYNPAILIKSS